MKHIRIILFGLVLILSSSCEEDINVNDFKSEASGLRGEVLIIMDDYYWENEAGKSIQEYFEKDLPATPQPAEPILSVRCYPHKNFNRNHKTNRNIVVVKFDSIAKRTDLKVEHDKWMKKQTYVEIISPNMEHFTSFMDKEGDKLVEVFLNDELSRVKGYFNAAKNQNALNLIKNKHDLNIIFPKEFSIVTNNDEFVSATHERMISRNGRMYDLQQGVLIYHYPYTSDSIFNSNYLIGKRDEILGKYVKGETDDVYMITNPDGRVAPLIDTVNHNGEFAVEIRGLWSMKNDFMGGPFISLTKVDKKNNRVVTAEGYVFAPNSPKRELIRDLEAIIYSLSF